MARDGAMLTPEAGETLEIFQAPDTSLLRLPAGRAALPALPAKTLRIVGNQLVAGAVVLKTNGTPGGSVSLAVPLDARLAAAASHSKLVHPN
jgi:hypothetical protein